MWICDLWSSVNIYYCCFHVLWRRLLIFFVKFFSKFSEIYGILTRSGIPIGFLLQSCMHIEAIWNKSRSSIPTGSWVPICVHIEAIWKIGVTYWQIMYHGAILRKRIVIQYSVYANLWRILIQSMTTDENSRVLVLIVRLVVPMWPS